MQNVMLIDGLRVHTVPKVGSASIDKALRRFTNRHASPDEPGEEYRWMVVRHPLDRLVSAWAYFCKKDGPPKTMQGIGTFSWMPFGEWLERVLPDPSVNSHVQPQVDFKGPFRMDRLCRLENLNSEWKALRGRFPCILPVERWNKTTHDPWPSYYTPAQRSAAERAFAADIDLYESSTPRRP